MAEKFKDKGKRLYFPKGKQKIFIQNCIKVIGYSSQEIADMLGISVRTWSDWKREKFMISEKAAIKLSRKSKIPLPKDVVVKEKFWYTTKGSRKGGFASYKKQGGKIGDPEYRLKCWRKWWEEKGQFGKRKILKRLDFRKPSFSEDLAEFFGIMMGDGGMSKRQIFITLHHKDDALYSKSVERLVSRLFKLKPSVRHIPKSSVNVIVLSRTSLVEYLHKLGLPVGNKIKQGLDMPDWIKNNKKFMKACLRGLVDTDGCIFTHSYKSKGKIYKYKKLSFSSASLPLILSVENSLKKLGLYPRIAKDNREVRLDRKEDIERYFKLIGFNNPKHSKRYKSVL